MIFKIIYMFFAGCVNIAVEGFFIERFLNICKNKKIFIKDLKRQNNAYLKAKILKSDFKEVVHIAKQTKCKIKIEKKSGVPFFINRYRKRKIFAIAILVIAIFIFIITKFVWNIEIVGNENLSSEEVTNLVNEYGIKVGTLKSKIDIQKISNDIRLDREDLSWIGINIKGTNAIITIEEKSEIPDIVDKNEICNIIASKDAVISKMIVQSGTAIVSVGDEVKKGDILVEGVMEGEHTGIRNVHAEADVFGEIHCEKERKENFVQNVTVKTGNEQKKNEICINNFKINLNKGVSKFKNYDTIVTNQKVKFFSNFYLPIEIKTTKYIELRNEIKNYTEDELKQKLETELEQELENEYEVSKYEDKNKNRSTDIVVESDGIDFKLIYDLREEIGIKTKLN